MVLQLASISLSPLYVYLDGLIKRQEVIIYSSCAKILSKDFTLTLMRFALVCCLIRQTLFWHDACCQLFVFLYRT